MAEKMTERELELFALAIYYDNLLDMTNPETGMWRGEYMTSAGTASGLTFEVSKEDREEAAQRAYEKDEAHLTKYPVVRKHRENRRLGRVPHFEDTYGLLITGSQLRFQEQVASTVGHYYCGAGFNYERV